jgi:hypothetical protein
MAAVRTEGPNRLLRVHTGGRRPPQDAGGASRSRRCSARSERHSVRVRVWQGPTRPLRQAGVARQAALGLAMLSVSVMCSCSAARRDTQP